MEIEDSEDLHVPFIAKDWIQAGKLYNVSTIPLYVILEKNKCMAMPNNFCINPHFPPPIIPITQFVAWKLPRLSSEITAIQAMSWFSKDEPNSDTSILWTRAVPSRDFIKNIEEAAGQAWLDGAKSITDLRYNDGTDRLPLWTISFWRKITTTHELQTMWERSISWLQREKSPNSGAAMELLTSLPWNATLTYGRGTMHSSLLSRFLGTAWLTDEHVDMMMEELDADKSSRVNRTQIATLSFANEIKNYNKGKLSDAQRKKTLLYRYEQEVHEHRLDQLAFPIHVNQNHWIAGLLNFRERTVSFGK